MGPSRPIRLGHTCRGYTTTTKLGLELESYVKSRISLNPLKEPTIKNLHNCSHIRIFPKSSPSDVRFSRQGSAPAIQLHRSSFGVAVCRPPWKVWLMSQQPQRPLAAILAVARPQLVKGFPAPPEKLAGPLNPPGRSHCREDRLVRSLRALGK